MLFFLSSVNELFTKQNDRRQNILKNQVQSEDKHREEYLFYYFVLHIFVCKQINKKTGLILIVISE